MPAGSLIFGNAQASGDQELAGASPLAVNVVTDGAGAVRRRPGIRAWSGAPSSVDEASPVIGMYGFNGELYYVNDNRHIYRIDPDTRTSTDLSTAGGPSYLDGTSRPVFAETQFRLLIAGGQDLEKVDVGESVAERVGSGSTAPPVCSHVAALASRALVNDLTDSSRQGMISYSRTGSAGNETFEGPPFGIVTAEARPDALVALFSNGNEAWAFGSRTLQVFTPDANVILAPSRAASYGCAAGYSVIEGDDSFQWLDDKRRFVTSDGRGAQELSAPIARTLDAVSTVTDCFGFRWIADQYDVLCWVFPTDGRTFAVQAGGGWAQWHGWTTGQGHTALPIRSHHFWPEENVHLVGLSTGQIAELTTSANDDLGATIKADVYTGFVSRETMAYKHCQAVRFFFKRGQASSLTTAPRVMLSWRDDLGAFCQPLFLSLGTSGDYTVAVERRSLGRYRTRQWRLEFTEAADYTLAGCTETYTVGDV